MKDSHAITFDQYLRIRKYAENTRMNYLYLYRRFREVSDSELSQASIDHFLSLYNHMMSRAMLKVLFKYLQHIGQAIPPMDIPKRQQKTHKNLYDISYTVEDIQALIRAAPDLQTELIIRLGFEGALRATEIADIRRQDIDLEKKEIRGMGKGSRAFIVKFSDDTRTILETYLDHMKEDEDHLFCKVTTGRKADRRNLDYYFKKVAQKVFPGRKGHLHMFRHSRLRLLREQNFDVMDIRDYARHVSVTSTQLYTQVDKRVVRAKVAQTLKKEKFT